MGDADGKHGLLHLAEKTALCHITDKLPTCFDDLFDRLLEVGVVVNWEDLVLIVFHDVCSFQKKYE